MITQLNVVAIKWIDTSNLLDFPENNEDISDTTDFSEPLLYEQYKNDKVISFRAVPEITHRKWKELNLMSPLKPDETPDFRFQELQMKLYYTIYL